MSENPCEPLDMADIMNDLINDSPLRQVDPASIDELLDRVNEHLVAGAPHMIRANDDRMLRQMVESFRTDALEWAQKEKDKPKRQVKKAGPDMSLAIEDL